MKRQLLIVLGMGTWIITMFQNCGPNPIQFGTGMGLTKIIVNDGGTSGATGGSSNVNPVDTIIDNTQAPSGSSGSSAGSGGSSGTSGSVSSGSSSSSGSSVASGSSGSSAGSSTAPSNTASVNTNTGSSGGSSSDSSSGSSVTVPPSHDHDAQAEHDADNADIAAEKDGDDDSDVDGSDHRGRHYVCMLDGKSEAIGLNDAVADGQVGSPKVVCMAKQSCEEIASAKFKVKGAVHKEYCKEDNDHSVHLTRGDMHDLISQMK